MYFKFIVLHLSTAEISSKSYKRSSQRQRWLERDEQAFGTPVDQSMEQDFDFEKNLALFNKEVTPFFSIHRFRIFF